MPVADDQSTTRFYHSNQQVGWGFNVWGEMATELMRSRELIWRLLWRDFIAKYKQSVLGILWALIMPLAMVGTFVFLNRSGILNIGKTEVPYPLFALLSLTVWQLFSDGLVPCAQAVVGGGSMVVKVNLPKEALVISAFGRVLIETLVRLGLLVLVFVFYQVVPCLTTILFPLVLLPLILLTLGLGLLFSLLNVFIRDIGNILTLGTTFLLFLTPVMYPSPDEGIFRVVMAYNPLAVLVGAARDMVLTGYLKEPVQYAWTSGLSLVVFVLSWRIFHMVEPRMAERI